MGAFLSDSSNQRKLAVALCAILALFSAKLPILNSVTPEILMTLIGVIGAWILQSGVKAAAEAHADGQRHAALITNADDAVATFKALADGGAKLAALPPPAP